MDVDVYPRSQARQKLAGSDGKMQGSQRRRNESCLV